MSAPLGIIQLVAGDAVRSEHEHCWEHRPLESGDVTRYQCSLCHRWGYRTWPPRGGKVKAIVAYASKSTEPKPKWCEEGSPHIWLRDRPSPLHLRDDEENPPRPFPPLRWRNHL
jgi:hypothetical protein